MTTTATSLSSISMLRTGFDLAPSAVPDVREPAHDDAGFAQALDDATKPEEAAQGEGEAATSEAAEEPAASEGEEGKEGGAHEDADAARECEEQAAAPAALPEAVAVLIADLPLTIHALNERLLQASGALAKAERTKAAPAERGENANAASELRARTESTSGAVGGGAGKDDGAQQSAGGGRVSTAGLPGPLDALAKAAESAQVAARVAQPARRAEGVSPKEAPTPGVNAPAAVPASAARPQVLREVRPVSTATPTVGQAQGPGAMLRPGPSKLRPTPPTPAPTDSKERAELFQAQVARAMVGALEKGRGTLTLRLKPEALGQLHIKVSMKDGVVKASFEAESAQARDLLNTTTGELRRSLEAAGLSVERIDASVSPSLREQAGPAPTGARFEAPSEWGSAGDGAGTPGRNESGLQSERRGTDAARPDADGAAEPLADGEERGMAGSWLVMGVDTIA